MVAMMQEEGDRSQEFVLPELLLWIPGFPSSSREIVRGEEMR